MSRTNAAEPNLSLGNRIYLYNVLKSAIGCGKQTLMPHVERALEEAHMDAEGLGFESTRALLEALDERVTLTIFKGGRIYATVIAQEAWDAALEAAAQGKPAPGGAATKSWKRKRADKTLRPVRPKRVKRPEAEPVPEPEPAPEPTPEPEPAASAADECDEAAGASEVQAGDATACAEGASEGSIERDAAPAADTARDTTPAPAQPADEASVPDEEPAEEPTDGLAARTDAAAEIPADKAPDGDGEPTSQPTISLTVTFDPENPDSDETTLEADAATFAAATEEAGTQPAADASVPAPRAAAPAPAADTPVRPQLPQDVPRDFTWDVFCPNEHLCALGALLPYRADVLGIMGEYFYIALERGELEAARNRLVFPLRYTADGERRSVRITLRRKAPGTPGPIWTVDGVE